MPSQVTSAFNVFLIGGTGGSLGPTEFPLSSDLVTSVPWDILPGTHIRAGLAGKVVVGSNPITLRVRVGDATSSDNSNTLVGGTVAYETILAAGSTTNLAGVGAPVLRPTGNRAFTKIMVTAFANAGSSSIDITCPVASVAPSDGFGQGMFFQGNANDALSADASEHLMREWLIDFDQFEGVSELLGAVSGQLDGGSGGTVRLRAGGTVGAGVGSADPDGAIICAWTNDGGLLPEAGTRRMGGGVSSVPNTFSGVLPVKLTLQNYGGGTHFAAALQEAH